MSEVMDFGVLHGNQYFDKISCQASDCGGHFGSHLEFLMKYYPDLLLTSPGVLHIPQEMHSDRLR